MPPIIRAGRSAWPIRQLRAGLRIEPTGAAIRPPASAACDIRRFFHPRGPFARLIYAAKIISHVIIGQEPPFASMLIEFRLAR
jgi:hypothetical protein